MISIVLVDDHPVFLQGLEALLSKVPHFEVVKTFSDSTGFFRYLAEGDLPEVVLLDIEMGSITGIEIASNVLQLYPGVKVIMLSTYFSDEYISVLVESGISGYLLKSTDFKELKDSIEKVAKGRFCCSPEIMEVVIEGFKKSSDAESSEGGPGKEPGQLTDREIELVRLIADELTMKEIANKLYLSEHTVKTHRKNLMAKLGVKNTAGLIKKAFLLGLIE